MFVRSCVCVSPKFDEEEEEGEEVEEVEEEEFCWFFFSVFTLTFSVLLYRKSLFRCWLLLLKSSVFGLDGLSLPPPADVRLSDF